MPKIVFDTNILLDYTGIGCSANQQKETIRLINTLCKHGISFIISPTSVKDFQYLLSAKIKSNIRKEKGEISPADANAVDQYVKGTLNNILSLGTVASLGHAECEMARTMCSTHHDYEDNLIAAIALRIGADCIVTRDKKFSAHAPIACLDPVDTLSYLENSVFV